MEDRTVTISRARFTVDYPAGFMLVAAMNPCPCGYFNHPERECTCNSHEVQRYLNKVSGPLLDRIDLHIDVTPVNYDELADDMPQEKSESIRERVLSARRMQHKRTERLPEHQRFHANAEMNSKKIRTYCKLNEQGAELLKQAMNKLGLSARAYDKILKVGRTIADLEGSVNILPKHIAEAIQYRSLDRNNWT